MKEVEPVYGVLYVSGAGRQSSESDKLLQRIYKVWQKQAGNEDAITTDTIAELSLMVCKYLTYNKLIQ